MISVISKQSSNFDKNVKRVSFNLSQKSDFGKFLISGTIEFQIFGPPLEVASEEAVSQSEGKKDLSKQSTHLQHRFPEG